MVRAEGPRPLNTFDPWGDDIPLHSARAWAESTLRLVEESRSARTELQNVRNTMPREFDEVSYPPLQYAFRTVWTTECMLVLSASQLEQWTRRLYISRRRRPLTPLPSLKHFRNAVEHAVEADLDEDRFVARPRSAKGERSGIGRLPGGAFSFAADQEGLFGVIQPDELERVAQELLDDLLAEETQWLDDISSWARRLMNRTSASAPE